MLLKPEERYKLEKGHLNTELRIYALIRLGITDVGQIAIFLHYSIQTIYNYKSKVKKMALPEVPNLEEEVKKTGCFHLIFHSTKFTKPGISKTNKTL